MYRYYFINIECGLSHVRKYNLLDVSTEGSIDGLLMSTVARLREKEGSV
jgi:hypothetical protein